MYILNAYEHKKHLYLGEHMQNDVACQTQPDVISKWKKCQEYLAHCHEKADNNALFILQNNFQPSFCHFAQLL